ncbi:hypothetical protein HZA33_04040 [Candidatus Pacearchaeota archaeon]|nr:hypothetical protein [Candidatus Pacearchaeota archaeon]
MTQFKFRETSYGRKTSEYAGKLKEGQRTLLIMKYLPNAPLEFGAEEYAVWKDTRKGKWEIVGKIERKAGGGYSINHNISDSKKAVLQGELRRILGELDRELLSKK